MSRNMELRISTAYHNDIGLFLYKFVRVMCYHARMDDQIIDAAMACSLHADACRSHALVGWIVMQDPPDYPGKFVARLVTNRQTPYLLLADTLAGVQEQLPSGLVRSDRQPADLPEVVEIWLAE
jgi:hypothetical protein